MGVSGKHFNIWPIAGVLFILALAWLLCLAAPALTAMGQSVPPVPSFAQPQGPPAGQVYMVRAWTPVRNALGFGPLYRPYVAIAPAQPAFVQPVVPVGGLH